MTTHLSENEICEAVLGWKTSAHAEECERCDAQIDRLTQPLLLFRSSVQHWSVSHMDRSFATAPVLLLMPQSLDRAWYSSLLQAVRDALQRRELPPLEVTSTPVELPPMWGDLSGKPRAAGAYSILIHCSAVALLVMLGSLKPVQDLVKQQMERSVTLAPYLSAKKLDRSGGGGGGGAREVLEASKGKLPTPAPRQFTPPRVDTQIDPKLPMNPTIVAPDDIPNIQANNYGDPLSRLGIPSNGIGAGGGIGSGLGGGVGSGRGNGVGPGEGGDFGGGVYRIGNGVSAPQLLLKVEPEYSEEARKAKWQGEVGLQVVVDANGNPIRVLVTKSLGLGLDEKAIEAVSKWRFKPGMRDGKPVSVVANISVNFRLL